MDKSGRLYFVRDRYREQLHEPHSLVYVVRSRFDGEQDLVRLARECKREVTWLYQSEGKVWYGIPSRFISSDHGMPDFHVGKKLVLYKTRHSTRPRFTLDLRTAIPQVRDMKMAVASLGNHQNGGGSIDFRIASSLGITEVSLERGIDGITEEEIMQAYDSIYYCTLSFDCQNGNHRGEAVQQVKRIMETLNLRNNYLEFKFREVKIRRYL